MTIDPIFVYANYAEACLWMGLAAWTVVRCTGKSSIGLGVALFAFGISDIIEARTGAWYEPWWLLTWKVLCVLLILIFGTSVARRRGVTQICGLQEPRPSGSGPCCVKEPLSDNRGSERPQSSATPRRPADG